MNVRTPVKIIYLSEIDIPETADNEEIIIIIKALGIETTDKWYTHMPKPVCEEGDVTVLWNQAVNTQTETLQQIGQIE